MFSLLTMVLTQAAMYVIMFDYNVTIMHIFYSSVNSFKLNPIMLDYNINIMHILYSSIR